MKKFKLKIIFALSVICLIFSARIVCADSSVIKEENFNLLTTETLSQNGFSTSGNATMSVNDGKLEFVAPSGSGVRELIYDISSLTSFANQRCNVITFEYDLHPTGIRYEGKSYKMDIFDNSGNSYSNIYIEAGSTATNFVTKRGAGDYPKSALKLTSENILDEEYYYNIKTTIDTKNGGKRTVVISTVKGNSVESVTFVENVTLSASANGTLGSLKLIDVDSWGYGTFYIDNIKITKSDLWPEMQITGVSPVAGTQFTSDKPEITVTFTNALADTEETKSAIILKDENGNSVANVTIDNNKAIVKPVNYLNYGKTYTLEVGMGVKDATGGPLKAGAVYTYTTLPDPTDREGTVYIRDTFIDASTLSEYSFKNDGSDTLQISDGLMKYNRSSAKEAGYFQRNLNIPANTSDILVFEYDLYPVNLRHDASSAYTFEFPAILDENGNKYMDIQFTPVANELYGSLFITGGAAFGSDFHIGSNYMYHITAVLDFENSKYRINFEENNLTTGETKTIICTSTDFASTAVSGNVSAFRFYGGHTWSYGTVNVDNLVVYKPVSIEFDEENSIADGETDVAARKGFELSFTNPLGSYDGKIIVKDKDGNTVETSVTLKNGGKTAVVTATSGRFEYNSEYTVTVGAVEDIFGTALSCEYVLNFTTGDVPPADIRFNGGEATYKYVDENGQTVANLANASKLIAEIKNVTNMSSDPDSVRSLCIVAGFYDTNGNLRKCAISKEELEAGETVDSLSAEIVIDSTIESSYTVRVIICDGIPGAPYRIQ